MLKAIASKGGKPCWIFGLSRGNCEKLLAGQPIIVDLDVMASQSSGDAARVFGAINYGSVVIMGGETELTIYQALKTFADCSETEIKIASAGSHASGVDRIA